MNFSLKKLLLLHGVLGSKAQVEPLAERIQHDFEVFTLNFSGKLHVMEQTPHPLEKVNIETLAAVIRSFLSAN